ncbi:MAG: carbohydrate kinase family protein [Caldilineales bacterium]|nr:carbohydrate kinase family protein [Caldilineales bacterium]
MSIIVTGSIAWDYLMRFPGYFRDHILPEHVHRLSVSFLVDDKERHRGGCAPNIAYSLALLGNRPKLMGTAGIDFDDYAAWLNSVGIDTSLTYVYDQEFTATFTVITDLDNNQIASFHTGAMARSRELSFHNLDKDSIDWVIIAPNDPQAMVRYAGECRELGIKFIYDPSQQLARIDRDEFMRSAEGAAVLTVNDYELEMAKKLSGLDIDGLLDHVGAVVVTRGAEGASVYTRAETHHVPVAKEEAIVEPTGVGDAFRSGLLTGLAYGFDWPTTLQLANVAAVYVLERVGTQNHSYSLDQYIARFRACYGDNPALEILRNRAVQNTPEYPPT